MKISRILSTWLDTAAKIWFARWLLIVGSALVFGSAILKWLDLSFSHHPFGLQFPLMHGIALVPHLSLLSYGVVGAAILAIGLVMLWRSTTVLALAAAVLLGLWVLAPCQIAFQQPALLVRLTTEARQVPMVRIFTKTYLPPNYGPAEEVPKHIELDTISDRILTACSFLDVGWYAFGFGSFLIGLYSVVRLPRDRGVAALVLGALPISAFVILALPPLIGQHFFTSARAAEAMGFNEKAISCYRKVLWWDPWRAQDVGIYRAIGDLERVSNGRQESAEKHISKAQEFKDVREYEAAIFELGRAAAAGGAVASAALRESARTRVDFGIALYRSGAIGAAVINWRQALAEDPLQQLGLSYLIARGDYDLARYQMAIDALANVLRISGDRPILANAYALTGDCYAKLGRDRDARANYMLSLSEDSVQNFWAMSGLVGN